MRPRSPPCRRGTGACFFCSFPCGASFRCAAGEFVCNRILPLLRFALCPCPKGLSAFAARRYIKVARGRAKIYGNVNRGRAAVLPPRRRQGGLRLFCLLYPAARRYRFRGGRLPRCFLILTPFLPSPCRMVFLSPRREVAAMLSIPALLPSFSRCVPHPAPPRPRRGGVERGRR